MSIRKRDDAAADYDAEVADNHRRTRVNRQLGMSPHHPYAFGLSVNELEEVEDSIREGDLPLPIITLDNGLEVLGDGWRMLLRAQKRGYEP